MPASAVARSWTKRVLALSLSLLFTEGLLRTALLMRAHFGTPLGCGAHPQLLNRLMYAYGGGHYAMLSIDSDQTAYDPHRGYKHRPGLRNLDVSGAPLSTDSLGLRGLKEFPVPKPAGVIRIVTLGDSLTFGEGVADGETWPGQLQTDMPGVEVANFGERGYAHDQMYFALADDARKLQPDAVILGFYDNDVWRDELTYYCYEKPRFSPGPQGWQLENVPVPDPLTLRNRYLLMPLIYAVPRGLFDMLSDPSMSVSGGEDRAEESIRRMREVATELGARFVIVNIPSRPEEPPRTDGFFHSYCSSTGTECVDPWPMFHAGNEDADTIKTRYLRPHDIHYSKAGYGVVAEALRRHFAEHPIIPVHEPAQAAVPH
jgi:hypothetical protein